jgi:FlaA1/EpsC-like NDP-sugar epimerase
MVRRLLKTLPSLSRLKKRSILVTYDLAAMIVALWAAFSTRLGFIYFPNSRSVIASAALSFMLGLIGLYSLRIYHIVLRYFDLRIVSRLLAASGIAATAWVIIVYATHPHLTVNHITFMVPRSVAFIYAGFLFLLLFMGRYVMALLLSGADRDDEVPGADRRNIVIYGANSAGISLASSVRTSPVYRLMAFVDPDPALTGQTVAGVPIYPPDALAQLASTDRVDEVFLAMPKATRSERLEAISQVQALNLEAKTVPGPEEIVSGRFTVSDIRPVDVADLLRRDPVEPLHDLIKEAVEGRTILVTGAGGSIGSEICRQALHAGPETLVLLDHSEFALYTIHEQLLELSEAIPAKERPKLVPVVGSMLNERLVRQLIADHGIDTLYHAAAYKHVPLLEDNELVGIENNVLGTLTVAQAALDSKLTRFTMISTDKAVRPKSVMGASKRVAELVIQAMAELPGCGTRFGIVRFGNVLDSSGSVVQRFRKQIRAGGPITVTHEDITRFFMSIPEATQLVLQASAMARQGEVFVLDMGEPVKITELAHHMVSLSGMTVRNEDNPTGDIAIEFVGLRPGEKLFEELFIGEESVETVHSRIRMAKERVIPQTKLDKLLDKLKAALDAGDRTLVRERLSEFIDAERREGETALAHPKAASGTDG